MQHIVKLCADHLRTISSNHGIKLKSSHAHELVAAIFGYKSKASLLADTLHPLSNLHQSSTIIFAPSDPIEQRRKNLQDLPLNFPDNEMLVAWTYDFLIKEKFIVSNLWVHPKQLAIFHADEYLRLNSSNRWAYRFCRSRNFPYDQNTKLSL